MVAVGHVTDPQVKLAAVSLACSLTTCCPVSGFPLARISPVSGIIHQLLTRVCAGLHCDRSRKGCRF